MTSQRRADWPLRLDAIARMRNRGSTWEAIALFYGVKKNTINNVRKRFAEELLAKMAEAGKEEATQATIRQALGLRPPLEPEIVTEDGITFKRFPPLWAEDSVFERYTVKSKARQKRTDG